MSQEQEQAFKYLKLIRPNDAEAMGIKAEAPVFISPMVKEGNCGFCGVHYTPLVYQTGYETRAQHFHGDPADWGVSGIFFSRGKPEGSLWVANLELIGEVNNLNCISEAVEVTSITPKCMIHGEELTEGLVVYKETPHLISLKPEFGLVPFCDVEPERWHRHKSITIPPSGDVWTFRVMDGALSFRPV